MSYYEYKGETAVRQAMSDIKRGLIGEHTTERMVTDDKVWLGYYRYALEIHGHRIDGNRVVSTKTVEPSWWRQTARRLLRGRV